METLESRLNFVVVENTAPAHAVKLQGDKSEAFYQQELISYCESNNIDISEDNCSAMIMADYASEAMTNEGEEVFWFWID